MENTKINAPKIIDDIYHNSWDEWLKKTESVLSEQGYRKFKQNYKNEDFAYWKSFYVNDKKAYMVGVLFYDFRKYKSTHSSTDRIGIQFDCMLHYTDCRIDLSVSKDIALDEFEEMAKTFYECMVGYAK